MTSKIRIKMGDVEVEYEGSEDFLRDELSELLSGVMELHAKHTETVPPASPDLPAVARGTAATGGTLQGTTNTIAAKLSVNSGAELIIAAVARIKFVEGQETASRATILKEMQSASSYYKQSYSKNLSKYLKTLVSEERLREVSKETYSLSAPEIQKLQGRLAS